MTLTELESICESCLKDTRILTYGYFYGLVLNKSRGQISTKLRHLVCKYYFYGKANEELRAFYFKEWANESEFKLFPHRKQNEKNEIIS